MEQATLGAMATVIVALIGLVGIMWRRNGQMHNPNFETLEGLLIRLVDGQEEARREMNEALRRIEVTLGRLDEKIGKCPTVQN